MKNGNIIKKHYYTLTEGKCMQLYSCAPDFCQQYQKIFRNKTQGASMLFSFLNG